MIYVISFKISSIIIHIIPFCSKLLNEFSISFVIWSSSWLSSIYIKLYVLVIFKNGSMQVKVEFELSIKLSAKNTLDNPS